jgi:hypothetical protein
LTAGLRPPHPSIHRQCILDFHGVETAVVYREPEAPHFETTLATGEK